MEAAIGGNFAAVRVQEHPYAQAIGVLAFTRGTDVFFAPGRYAPTSPAGLELLGHELAHVKQQAEGRVAANTQIGGAAANDDPSLEHEADMLGAKAAHGEAPNGEAPAASKPSATASHAPVQAKAAPSDAEPPRDQPRIEAVAGPVGAEAAGLPPIQAAPDAKPAKHSYISFSVPITKPMTGEEFKVAANLQVFGSASAPGEWQHVKASYTPDHSPVEVQVATALVHRVRGAANAAKGIDTDATGKVAGADARAKDFQAQPASDEKSALLSEIDRRYFAASGQGTKIASGDTGHSDLWRTIRDEVLFQHQYLANLPDNVKALIKANVKGRELTPADYDQLFRIAKKIQALPPGAAADYASKLTGSTTNLQTFEDAIEHHRGELADREQADAARAEVQNKLLGLEDVYKLYRLSRATTLADARRSNKSGIPRRTGEGPSIGEQLDEQLRRHGFASEADFAAYIKRFERAFEDGAVRVTLDLLDKYAGKIHREAQRYQNQETIHDLHGKLGGFRAQHQAFDANAKLWNDYAAQHNRDARQEGLPGNGHIHAKPPTPAQTQARQNAQSAKAGAEASIQSLAKDYPIFAEDDLPVDKRLDKAKLAQADETQLGALLQAHIADRVAVVAAARGQLEGKHELIYKMDKLMPAFYAQMDIQPGSIHDQIIKDKLHDDAIGKLVGGILLAVAAIALTVVSLGAATPAIVAAGASIGAAGLSTYMAYDEYKEYTSEHAIADAGFADDPSVVWLVLALVGAGVDMAAASNAVRLLAPAARTFATGGEVTNFTKAVAALRTAEKLDAKIAAAADKAATARSSYAAAKGELSMALGKAYSFPGPFTDPEVYRALVKMAAAKIKEGSHSLAGFIAELKQARLAAKLADLTPEELIKAKEAWAQADKLAKLVSDPALLEKLLAKIGDSTKLERLLSVFPAAELEGIVEKLANPERIVTMLDHVGTESTGKMIREWIAKGQITKADNFLARMGAGVGNELAETAAIGAKSIIIDSNTVIALSKDADPALRATMTRTEISQVAYIKQLPPGTELRVGNVTVGETGGTLSLRGMPIDVLRDTPEYTKVLNKLAAARVGKAEGFADQALVADMFFAKAEAGVTPKFVTADANIVNKLARIAGMNVDKMGGFPVLMKRFGGVGFDVTIERRTIRVIPVR